MFKAVANLGYLTKFIVQDEKSLVVYWSYINLVSKTIPRSIGVQTGVSSLPRNERVVFPGGV